MKPRIKTQHSGKVPLEVLLTRLILFMILGCQDLFIRHHQEYICQAFFWTKQRMALTDVLMGIFIGGGTNVMYIDASRRDSSPSFNYKREKEKISTVYSLWSNSAKYQTNLFLEGFYSMRKPIKILLIKRLSLLNVF